MISSTVVLYAVFQFVEVADILSREFWDLKPEFDGRNRTILWEVTRVEDEVVQMHLLCEILRRR